LYKIQEAKNLVNTNYYTALQEVNG